MLAALALAGCGGNGQSSGIGNNDLDPTGTGEVSGIVFDINTNPVRDARVFFEGKGDFPAHETSTNSTGSYVIEEAPGRRDGYDFVMRASATIDGERYIGQNIATVYNGERTRNVNISLYPEGDTGAIEGNVFAVNGDTVQFAQVFVKAKDGSMLTSAVGVTDERGFYRIEGLRAGITYNLQANAYGSDTDYQSNVVLTRGRTTKIDFELDDSTDPRLPAPQNLIATAWTSPAEATRDASLAKAIEGIKNLIKPNRKPKAITRNAENGWPIEVDLEWDEIDANSLYGFGVYRAAGSDQLEDVDLVRDPAAIFYADNDPALRQDVTYRYGLTTLSTLAGDSDRGESALSNTYSVRTLGALAARTPTTGPLTFRWDTASGAEEYLVYVFRDYPTATPDVLWQSAWVTGTSVPYSGPSLTTGRTYYFLVVGRANDGDSLTVSRVESFRP